VNQKKPSGVLQTIHLRHTAQKKKKKEKRKKKNQLI
jgi:hypothetical protein